MEMMCTPMILQNMTQTTMCFVFGREMHMESQIVGDTMEPIWHVRKMKRPMELPSNLKKPNVPYRKSKVLVE